MATNVLVVLLVVLVGVGVFVIRFFFISHPIVAKLRIYIYNRTVTDFQVKY